MLMPLLNYFFMKKQGGKKDLVKSVGLSGFEVIFILLAEIIII